MSGFPDITMSTLSINQQPPSILHPTGEETEEVPVSNNHLPSLHPVSSPNIENLYPNMIGVAANNDDIVTISAPSCDFISQNTPQKNIMLGDDGDC